MAKRISVVYPGDTIRVVRPEFKGMTFTALSVMSELVEIQIGEFIHASYVQKKFKNRYITPILHEGYDSTNSR
jgi:hypothetical protein